MNTIYVSHTHAFDKDTACEKAEDMLEELAANYGLKVDSDGTGLILFEGTGIKGSVEINHDDICISAKLGFLMVAMKSVIANEIKNKLEERFS
jgi:putative polyhydroxyalkanoate system protein